MRLRAYPDFGRRIKLFMKQIARKARELCDSRTMPPGVGRCAPIKGSAAAMPMNKN